MSLLNCVPYMLTCQRVLRAYVLTCLACLLVNVPCVLKCSHANALMCLCANVLTCKRASSSLSHLPAFLALLVSDFDATFFSFFAIVIEVVHSDGEVWQFNEYFINRSLLAETLVNYWEVLFFQKLLRCGRLRLGGLQMFDGTYFFNFTSFNTTPLILLVKIVLMRNYKSLKGD